MEAGLFRVQSVLGWPFQTGWGMAAPDSGVTLDKETAKGLRQWARLGLDCQRYLTEAKLIAAGLSSGRFFP